MEESFIIRASNERKASSIDIVLDLDDRRLIIRRAPGRAVGSAGFVVWEGLEGVNRVGVCTMHAWRRRERTKPLVAIYSAWGVR